jgi:hypothetical protein
MLEIKEGRRFQLLHHWIFLALDLSGWHSRAQHTTPRSFRNKISFPYLELLQLDNQGRTDTTSPVQY